MVAITVSMALVTDTPLLLVLLVLVAAIEAAWTQQVREGQEQGVY